MNRSAPAGTSRRPILFVLFFASGAAALIYQVLWLKELGRLFGVTAFATATTLAVFFLGLAAGSLAWGNRASRSPRPLRLYALLEIGVAISACLYFFLYALYGRLYPLLFELIEGRATALLLFKFLLALGVLLPPAFLMGGTLPVMGEVMIAHRRAFGSTASLLYGVNTVGAATGALAAGFFLPRALGFRGSYLVAIALSLLVGFVAWTLARDRVPTSRTCLDGELADPPSGPPLMTVSALIIAALAASSGFLTLALEVLWTRMFAQVLQNSVYTFSLILTVFLIALALGSVLANRLCRVKASPRLVLFSLLIASGILVSLTPLIFYNSTGGLQPLGSDLGWSDYLPRIAGNAAIVLLLPTVVVGSVFPYLMKLAESQVRSAGSTLGRLAGINTLAAITGSLVAGFLLLDLFGLWASIRLIGAAYLLLTLLALPSSRRLRGVLVATVVTTLLVLTTTLPYGTYENVYIDREMGEELLDLTEGSHGTVAVVRRGDDLRLKLDNSYLLGTSASAPNLRLQSWIPMSLHPAPKKVFYLGMGTGITAGAALDLPIESVTVTELNPDVIDSARVYFSSFLNGLFEDPRVDIRQEDGRNLLFASPNTYDVVIADIFLTHKAGTGSLYTREHFETIRSRLDAGGLFAQWLPMFELSEEEFGIIARTMLDVFPQVTLWSRGFSPKYPVMALVGQTGGTPLDQDTFIRNVDELSRRSALPEDTWFLNIPLAAYAGNLTVISNAYSDYPVSTDDRVPLEYLAPIIERDRHATGGEWELAWRRLAELREGILRRSPPDSDPYLERLDTHQLRQIEAGLRFYSSETYRRTGDSDLAEAELERYRRLLARPENQN